MFALLNKRYVSKWLFKNLRRVLSINICQDVSQQNGKIKFKFRAIANFLKGMKWLILYFYV